MTRAYVCVKISEYTPSWDWTCLHVYKISRYLKNSITGDNSKIIKGEQQFLTCLPNLLTHTFNAKYFSLQGLAEIIEPFRGK